MLGMRQSPCVGMRRPGLIQELVPRIDLLSRSFSHYLQPVHALSILLLYSLPFIMNDVHFF